VLSDSKKYTRFSIPKKRGGRRIIQEPVPNLKIIQHKLLHVLQAIYEPKPAVHGFVAERNNEYRLKYCHKKLDKPYKVDPLFHRVVKGKIEFLGMVRGHTDKLFVRFNNQAAELERDSKLDSHLFDFLADSSAEILSLIDAGEIEQVEFKAGACLNPHTGKPDKTSMSGKVLKEVAAFLNSEFTGTILIGVKDDDTDLSDRPIFVNDKFFVRSGTRAIELKGY
jgi:hypothetical protein